MRFSWTTLHVKNLDTSIAFYKEFVGLEVNRRFKPNESMELAFLGADTTELELIADGRTTNSSPDDISIGFILDCKLEEQLEKLAAKGFTEQSPIFAPGPYMRYAYVKDPDGFKVQFVEDNR